MTKQQLTHPEARTSRLGLLDGLRLTAALMVLLYHYTAWGHEYWGAFAPEAWPVLSNITRYGQIGVQLFFLISGFVILMSLQGKRLSQFIGSRVGRLYPAYWIAVIAAAILCFKIWPHISAGRTISDIVPNLSMMQAAFNVPHLDGVYWTLWIELKFYMLLGLLLFFGLVRTKHIMWLCAIWPAIALYLHFTPFTTAQDWTSAPYASLFAVGMLLYLTYQQGHSPLRWLLIALNTAAAAYFTGLKGHKDALVLSKMDVPAWHYYLLIVLCVGLIAVVTLTPLHRIETKWLAVAGSLTFPLYLFHQLWGWWLIHEFSSQVNKYALLTGIMTVMLLWAYVVAQFIEKPVGRLLRKYTTIGLDLAGEWAQRNLIGPTWALREPKYQQWWRQNR